MCHKSLGFALLIMLAISAPAWAEIGVTIGNLDLAPGGTGFVEVSITGDNDLLQAAGFEFRIQSLGPTSLEFVDPQPYDYLSDSGYVFSSDSFALDYPPVGGVSETVVPGDTFLGGDMTLSMADVTVTSFKLLARLQVTANTMLPPEAGDLFTISLEPSLSTYFSDSGFNTIGYSATTGTVNIVPEPGTITLLLVSAVFLMLSRLSPRLPRNYHETP